MDGANGQSAPSKRSVCAVKTVSLRRQTWRPRPAAYLDAVHKLLTPRMEAFFPGESDPAKLSFFERTIGRMVKSPEGDLRDWTAIRAWADELRPALGL